MVNRGKITFWFSEEVVNSWWAEPSGKPGAQPIYSDTAIETISILRFRFSLDLRATQGFAQSIVEMIGLDIEVPDYSTLCRRLKKISPKVKKMFSKEGNIHIVIDSTGLKVYGEGEWKVRQHGYSKKELGKNFTWQ